MTEIPDDVVERIWRDICEKTDRTSPAEYPDMTLITLDELRAALRVGVEWAVGIAKAYEDNDAMHCSTDAGREGFRTACREIERAIRSRTPPPPTTATLRIIPDRHTEGVNG